ncbi:carboxypeptidase-like regulatory domain-containing protein [Hymenobacter sp. 5516J-16]|uniref:carboxypeptidase-like regulatory domain-containing protein n=1 Tax=Hymenobacter sp. 5516J-16 TaxID=2932253 RepID=UPI001FD59DCB|nr:carboxypeptidase-like regulatory domain-containing protein [Hymenobacter sp. 5516J-16]UOQ75320.1 carboxypeptidase-like regulatory domain-containing protein [Hymenobacter sp. 5516J-16]
MLLPNAASEPTASRHLPLEVLRRYVAGTLEPLEQHRVEAHTSTCPRCADVLEGLALQPAAVTDTSLADLRQRLHARVEELAMGSKPKPPLGWAWQQLAAAAVLLCTIGAALVWLTANRLQSRATIAAKPAAEAVASASTTPAPAPLRTAEPAVSASSAIATVSSVAPASSLRRRQLATRRPSYLARSVLADGPAVGEPMEQVQSGVAPPDAYVAAAAAASADSVHAAGKPPVTADVAAASLAVKAKRRVAEGSASAPLLPQNLRTIQGRVTDAAGVPLPGATVLVPGTQQGAVTNSNGSFSLQVPTATEQLTISSIGYTAQTRALRPSDSTLALALSPSSSALSEVVVVRRDAPPAPMLVGAMPAGGYTSLKKYLRDSLDYPKKPWKLGRKAT